MSSNFYTYVGRQKDDILVRRIENGKRVTEVGGVSKAVMDLYWICFVPDDKDRIEALQVLGLATNGFDLAFGEKAAKIEPEFDCKPYDEAGHKFKLTETVAAEAG